MDVNRETILDELNDFEKRSSDISPILEDYLLKIAKTGDTMFPWVKLKPLLRKKLELVLDDFYETCPTDSLPPLPNVEAFKFEILKNKILEALDSFHSAPFTIQRICELLTTPRKHYKRTDKFMRGLEKNILVVSTIEPKSRLDNEVNNNAAGIMNGLISSSNNEQNCKESSPSSTLSSAVKLNNCHAQYDNFGMLSASSPIIITEIAGVLQKEKNEISESVKDMNSNNSGISDNNSNVSEMDVTSFRDSHDHHLCENNTDNTHSDGQSDDNSSPDLTVALNSNTNQTLENFTIFSSSSSSSSSSVTVNDVTSVSSSEKPEASETDKNFNSNSSEREIDLSTFQENDTHLVESAMEIATAVVSDESYVETSSHVTSPSHSSPSESQDFFQDLCCSSSREEHNSSVFPHDSTDNFRTSSTNKIKGDSLSSGCITEETIATSCNTTDMFHDDKSIGEKKENSYVESGCGENNESSEKQLFHGSLVSHNSSIPQDSLPEVSEKDADVNQNMVETANVLSAQDVMDLESSATSEQISFPQDNEDSSCTNEESVEMEQD